MIFGSRRPSTPISFDRSLRSFPSYGTAEPRRKNASEGVREEIDSETDRIARTIFDATRQLTLSTYLPADISPEVAQDFFDENKPELLQLYKQAIAQILEAKKTGQPSALVAELITLQSSLSAPSSVKTGIEAEPTKEEVRTQRKIEDIIGSVSALKLLELSDATDAALPVAFTSTLHRNLFSFQRAGVVYLASTGRSLLTDEQGTGKTTQALTVLRYLQWLGHNALPVLIVCPKNVKLNWALETIRVSPEWRDKIALLGEYSDTVIDVARVGKVKLWGEDKATHADVIICNYDLVDSRYDLLKSIPFLSVIADESHRIKNPKAKRTEALIGLAEELDIPFRFALTGTPFVKDTMELYPQLEFLGVQDKPQLAHFEEQFAIKVSGVEESSTLNLDDKDLLLRMNKVLRSTCMVRREKKDVLKDLPPKRRYVHCIEIDNRAEYDAAYEEFKIWLLEQFANRLRFVIALLQGVEDTTLSERKKFKADISFVRKMVSLNLDAKQLKEKVEEYVVERVSTSLRAMVLTKLGKLKQIAARGKVSAVRAYLDGYLSESIDNKALVFGWHKEIVLGLSKTFNAPVIYGQTGALERYNIVETFQYEDKPRICVLNLLSGREGLTLTRASRVVFVELGWDAMTHDQAEDRAHRIDPLEQKRTEVQCVYFLAKNTIDIAIANFIERKRDLTRVGISADESDTIPEGRINQGCGLGQDGGGDVGGFIRSLITSERDDRMDIPLEEMIDPNAFVDIVKAIQDAENAERLASRDEEVSLFYQEQREDDD